MSSAARKFFSQFAFYRHSTNRQILHFSGYVISLNPHSNDSIYTIIFQLENLINELVKADIKSKTTQANLKDLLDFIIIEKLL